MSPKFAIARNMLWNWAGMLTPMLAGFVVAPFLVHRLGDTVYGLWILIASMTSYFGLLDLGVRGSVGRYIAYHRAKDDPSGVNAIASTAMTVLCGAAVLAAAGTLVLLWLFFRIFDVPADEVDSCRLALLIVGINLALTFPLNVFDAALWAFQRFDLLNAVDIPAVVLRTALTFYLVGAGQGLVALALVTMLTAVAAAVVKAWLSFAVEPTLRLRPDLVRKWAFHSLCSYGIWLFVISVMKLIIGQINPVVIGARLAVQLVTPYSIAVRLLGYAVSVVLTGANVLTPVATVLHAQGGEAAKKQMFVRGGTYCALMALFFLTLFIFLGRPFIGLWMGPELEGAATLLIVLAVGETLPMSQWVTFSMVLGIGRHRFLAGVSLLECALVVGGTVALLGPFGLLGACVALAVPATLCRGVMQIAYGCRVVEVPLADYCRQALLRPLLSAVPPALVLGLATYCRQPESWVELVAFGAVYTAFFLGTWVVFFDPDQLKHLRACRPAAKVRGRKAKLVSVKALRKGGADVRGPGHKLYDRGPDLARRP